MSNVMNNKRRGFTIVELLIVIVVIAILAAISVVAYRGIQNRAADTAVKTDLRNFAGKIMEYNAAEGRYPLGGYPDQPVGMAKFKFNRSAYDQIGHNIVYCHGYEGGVAKYIVAARSKSGNRYGYSSDKGLHDYGSSWGGVIEVCTNANLSSFSFSYGYRGGSPYWWPWTE